MDKRKVTIIQPMVQLYPKIAYDFKNMYKGRKFGEKHDAVTQTSLLDWQYMKEEFLTFKYPPLVQQVMLPNKDVNATTAIALRNHHDEKDKIAENPEIPSQNHGQWRDGITSSSCKSRVDKIKEDYPPFKNWTKKVSSDKFQTMHFISPSYGESQPMFPFPSMTLRPDNFPIAEAYGKNDGQKTSKSETSTPQGMTDSRTTSTKENPCNETEDDVIGTSVHYTKYLEYCRSKNLEPHSRPTGNNVAVKKEKVFNPFKKASDDGTDSDSDDEISTGKTDYMKYLQYHQENRTSGRPE